MDAITPRDGLRDCGIWSVTTSELLTRSQQALLRHLDSSHPGWATDARVVVGARILSEGFTRRPEERTPDLDERTLRTAYLAYFAPRAIAATAHTIGSAYSPKEHPIVLDIGAGTGGASVVFGAAGARRVVLVDRDPQALAVAERIIGALDPAPLVESRSVDFFERSWKAPFANFLVSAFSMGELLRHHDASSVLDKLLEVAPNANSWLLIDAGDVTRARKLQELRELALARGFTIAAPCPHLDACPALARKKDWCHSKIERSLPERLAEFARAVGRDDVFMNLSYLSLKRDVAVSAQPPTALRVLGEPMREKGRVRLPVCGPNGVRFLQALKRHRVAHDTLLYLGRGQEFEMDEVPRKGETAHIESEASLHFHARAEKDG